MTRVVAFVPMKLNNQRLPGKNTRQFGDGTPMFRRILEQLALATTVSETFVYCSSPSIAPMLPASAIHLARPTHLDTDTTAMNAVALEFAKTVSADIYLLAHATAPFLNAKSIDAVVGAVTSGDHDSALTVIRRAEFLWRDGEPANYDPANIPRTQDLPPTFAETSGAYAYRRELILESHRRVGFRPALVEVSAIEALDVDDLSDFELANAVHMSQLPG